MNTKIKTKTTRTWILHVGDSVGYTKIRFDKTQVFLFFIKSDFPVPNTITYM